MKNNNKIILLFITILLFLLLPITLVACDNNTQSDQDNTYVLKYNSPEFGGYYISGERYQTIKKGEDGTEVTVLPYYGYVFVKWSDGITTHTRRELNVQECLELTPIFAKQTFAINFSANDGGYLIGESNQIIEFGTDISEVTAVPYDGYIFTGWSDGIHTELRDDKNIENTINATANFIRDVKTLQYQKNILSSVYPQSVTLNYGNLAAAIFHVPTRDGYNFDGWYLDPEFTIKVTDGDGYYYRGNTIFYDEGNTLYPKWTLELNQTFKLLLVFVEESYAQLPTHEEELIEINYKMPLIERKICELIPNQISGYLNDWFKNSVKFEVDVFYATTSIGIESYHAGMSFNGKYSYSVSALDIPDVFPILNDYRSIITTLNMNDFDYKIHTSAGSATQKYGCVHMESFLPQANSTKEEFLNLNNINWNPTIDTYLHEFTHTVESSISAYEFHKVLSHYASLNDWSLQPIKLYLLNNVDINGEKVGIPIEFWKGLTNISVGYFPSYVDGVDNGKIIPVEEPYESKDNFYAMQLPFGSEITVEAIPFDGYRFVKWSDGVTTSIRRDSNIISYIKVFAIFEKIYS